MEIPAADHRQPDATYRCPGDGMVISRSIHFGRLASFYPACRECEYRTDVGALDSESVRRIAETHSRAQTQSRAQSIDLFTDEGLEGLLDNQIDSRTVRRFAAAVGIASLDCVPHTTTIGPPAPSPRTLAPPKLVLGADGRPLTAELLAAASEGLRQAGCAVVEVEAVTAPALCHAICELDAAGGLFLGNPRSLPHAVGLRVWSRGAAPASAGGRLDPIRQAFVAGAPRPVRFSGGLERHVAHTRYLARFSGLFHALRPLTFALDTSSSPLAHYVRQLTAATACRILPPRPQNATVAEAATAWRGSTIERKPTPSGGAACSDQARLRRLAWLTEQVPAQRADFGIWIDGDGERCAVIDERGSVVAADVLLAAIARLELTGESGAAVVVAELATSPRTLAALQSAGISAAASSPLRERMYQTLCESGAAIGGGPSGRFWFAGPPATPDALALLAWLLAVLSRSDRRLSAVLGGNGK